MGGKTSKLKLLKAHELDEYAKMTAFTNEELNDLYTHFKAISAIEKDDGVIDYDEFCTALKIPKSLVAERIFEFFDVNHDNVINFREFITAISVLVQDNIESQIKLTFNIFDFEKSGIVRMETLKKLIKSAAELVGTIKIPEECINELVENTFQQLNIGQNREDLSYIDFNQYRIMIRDNPMILKWLFIDLEKMKISAQEIMKNSKAFIK